MVPAPDQPARVERRIVTVLFADLVGFTPLSERLDPEDVGTIQDAYFGAVAATIERYGGQVEKYIGDAAMAVFGLPRTRDDDAERAVRAGLALILAVDAVARRLGLETGHLQIRVGVNTGEVAATEVGAAGAAPNEGRVTGDAVNTAARLQAEAPPGRVLIGETTALAVAEAIELEPAAPVTLKGKTAPIRASLAAGIRPERSRDTAMGNLRAALVGRADDLVRLDRFVAAARAGDRLRVLLVAPPGVGKTRLVQELTSRLDGVHLLRARLRADALSPFDAIVQLLGDAASVGPGDRSRLLGVLDQAGVPPARAEVIAEDVLHLVAPAAGQPVRRSDRAALFDAWTAALDALATGKPAAWLIEDLHWADPDLLRFLDAANDRPSAHGRLILATGRPALLERIAASGTAESGPGWTVVELGTLGSGSAGELVTSLVGHTLPASLVVRIAERSDGNPLFIEELLRTWISVGTLVPATSGTSAGAWRLAVPAEDVALPPTVQAIYAAQLDDLPVGARQAVRRASVAGRRFPTAALDPLDVPDVAASLATLERRGLIGNPEVDPITGPGYAYRHALLRDAGYASLSRAERARLHVRLARWLERTAGERSLEVAELIGNHFALALESTPLLAIEVGEGVDRAMAAALAGRWLERAGDLASLRTAHAAARTLYARSVDLSAGEPALVVARRLSRLGEATARVADLEDAASAFERSADRYRGLAADEAEPATVRTEARRGHARAAAARSSLRYEQMRFAEARSIAEAALRLTGEDDPQAAIPLRIARLNALEGLTNDYLALYAESREVVRVAEASADPDLAFAARRVELGLGHAAGVTAPDDWLEFASVAAGRERWEAAVGAMVNAAALIGSGDRDRVRALAGQAEAIAEARGLTERLAWIHQARCELELEFG